MFFDFSQNLVPPDCLRRSARVMIQGDYGESCTHAEKLLLYHLAFVILATTKDRFMQLPGYDLFLMFFLAETIIINGYK
jgi:hypothetical protein